MPANYSSPPPPPPPPHASEGWPKVNGWDSMVLLNLTAAILGIPFFVLRLLRFRRKQAEQQGASAKRPGCCSPPVTGLMAQAAAIAYLFLTAMAFGAIRCDASSYLTGLPWRLITSTYGCASTAGYFFLYAKQKSVGGGAFHSSKSRTEKWLVRVFRVVVPLVPAVSFVYFMWLVQGYYDTQGVCRAQWYAWAPALLCAADTSLGVICVYLFVKPFLHGDLMKDKTIRGVIKQNLYACLLVQLSTFVTMLMCMIDGALDSTSGNTWPNDFMVHWLAFDKLTDIVAVNMSFQDFRIGNAKAKVGPSSDRGSTEALSK